MGDNCYTVNSCISKHWTRRYKTSLAFHIPMAIDDCLSVYCGWPLQPCDWLKTLGKLETDTRIVCNKCLHQGISFWNPGNTCLQNPMFRPWHDTNNPILLNYTLWYFPLTIFILMAITYSTKEKQQKHKQEFKWSQHTTHQMHFLKNI